MVGGDEQAHLPRQPPPQRWWVVILKIVSLSLLMFPSSTGGKWQFDFKPEETRPLPTALAPGGERGGEGGLDCRQATSDEVLCGACMSRAARAMCVVCRGVCGV